ncbi:MAG: hypothetical protein K8W52_46095 [Deltaproteobacteria bacterium]|nr:hypothetical protein [Deltaproteobacteria bacterium]
MASITDADVRAIRDRPLRSLDGADLSKYAARALNTWGDQDEFRYYLPRLLELLVRQPGWTDEATLIQKLESANWRSWPEIEQRAIEAFLRALWMALLSGEVTHPPMAALVQGVAGAGIPVQPIIDAWTSTAGYDAALQLADLITLSRRELLKDGALGSRWPADARAALLRGESARAKIGDAFFHARNRDDETLLSAALEVLEAIAVGSHAIR